MTDELGKTKGKIAGTKVLKRGMATAVRDPRGFDFAIFAKDMNDLRRAYEESTGRILDEAVCMDLCLIQSADVKFQEEAK